MKRSIAYGWFVVTMLMIVAPPIHGQQGGRFHVDCDGGGPKLTKAIELAKPGDTIEVSGTCRERIKVTRGPLVLDGGGDAILDGAGVGPNEPHNRKLHCPRHLCRMCGSAYAPLWKYPQTSCVAG